MRTRVPTCANAKAATRGRKSLRGGSIKRTEVLCPACPRQNCYSSRRRAAAMPAAATVAPATLMAATLNAALSPVAARVEVVAFEAVTDTLAAAGFTFTAEPVCVEVWVVAPVVPVEPSPPGCGLGVGAGSGAGVAPPSNTICATLAILSASRSALKTPSPGSPIVCPKNQNIQIGCPAPWDGHPAFGSHAPRR